jgi:hypothetical protein
MLLLSVPALPFATGDNQVAPLELAVYSPLLGLLLLLLSVRLAAAASSSSAIKTTATTATANTTL